MKAKVMQGGARVIVKHGWTDEDDDKAEELAWKLHNAGFRRDSIKSNEAERQETTIHACDLWPNAGRRIHHRDALNGHGWLDIWLDNLRLHGVGVTIEMVKGSTHKRRLRWKMTIEGIEEGGASLQSAASKVYKAWLNAGRPIDGVTLEELIK